MIASTWELVLQSMQNSPLVYLHQRNTGSVAVSSAVTTTNGASALETKDTAAAAAGAKKKRWTDSKGFSGRQEEGIMETKMEQEEKWGTAGVDVCGRKSSTLNSRMIDESQTDRLTRTKWTGSVQPAVFRTHAVSCLIRFTSTTHSP